MLLKLGLALAAERSPAAVTALRQAVTLASAPHDRAEAALMSARALGLWGHHDSVTAICRDALTAGQDLGPAADDLEAELFASSFIAAATTGDARVSGAPAPGGPGRIHRVARLRRPVRDGGRPASRRCPGPPGPGTCGRPAPACPPGSLAAVLALLVLILERRTRHRRPQLRRRAVGRPRARLHEHGGARQLPALDDHASPRQAG